jgi:hypothetical protein
MTPWITLAHNERLGHSVFLFISFLRSLLSLLGFALYNPSYFHVYWPYTVNYTVVPCNYQGSRSSPDHNMFLRPGFVVVIVGATLTSLSTVVVALRYVWSLSFN